MEYTGNFMQDNTHLTSSLLKMFSMFEIRLSCGDDDLYKVCLKCVNCKKGPGLNAETGFKTFYDEVITQFLLNAMLHHLVLIYRRYYFRHLFYYLAYYHEQLKNT